MLPTHLLPRLSPTAAKVYLVLRALAQPPNSHVQAPIAAIAQLAAFTPRACWKAIHELISLGLICRLPRRYHAPNTYDLLTLAPPNKSPTTVNPPSLYNPPTGNPHSYHHPPTMNPGSQYPSQPPHSHTKSPTVNPRSHLLNTSPPLRFPIPRNITPLSIVQHLCAGNLDALPPEIQHLPSAHLEAYLRHLCSRLTPEEKVQAIATAQVNLAPQSPKTLQNAQELLHAP